MSGRRVGESTGKIFTHHPSDFRPDPSSRSIIKILSFFENTIACSIGYNGVHAGGDGYPPHDIIA
jgi:hypothetical protein